MDKKVLIILPAYNEEESVGMVINHIHKQVPAADILVVNDGSTDSTSKVAQDRGAFIIDLPFNLGIGAAMQTGYKFANRQGYDIAVQCDADGQHPPYLINYLMEHLIENNADIVVGSRFLKKYSYKSSVPRQIGIALFSRLISLITSTRLTDTTCGFRALNKNAIRYFSEYYPCDYPEVEALVLAHRAGLKIKEVPVKIYRRKGGISSIGFLSSFYYTLKVFLSIVIDLFEEVPYRKEV
jgi:glycosyltransferase involved in cell wall biosynthesis